MWQKKTTKFRWWFPFIFQLFSHFLLCLLWETTMAAARTAYNVQWANSYLSIKNKTKMRQEDKKKSEENS